MISTKNAGSPWTSLIAAQKRKAEDAPVSVPAKKIRAAKPSTAKSTTANLSLSRQQPKKLSLHQRVIETFDDIDRDDYVYLAVGNTAKRFRLLLAWTFTKKYNGITRIATKGEIIIIHLKQSDTLFQR